MNVCTNIHITYIKKRRASFFRLSLLLLLLLLKLLLLSLLLLLGVCYCWCCALKVYYLF